MYYTYSIWTGPCETFSRISFKGMNANDGIWYRQDGEECWEHWSANACGEKYPRHCIPSAPTHKEMPSALNLLVPAFFSLQTFTIAIIPHPGMSEKVRTLKGGPLHPPSVLQVSRPHQTREAVLLAGWERMTGCRVDLTNV